MNNKIRKILELFILIGIIGISVCIFLFRDRFRNISSISYPGILLLCFLANSTVLLPSPSLMLVAGCALMMNPFLVALMAALGSSAGELTGYLFGSVGKDMSDKVKKRLEQWQKKIHHAGFWVFLMALLPLPLFDVAGIYSGGTGMSLWKFYIACFLGKFLKMLFYTKALEWIQFAYQLI